jgi:pathogenesis-related protein 1
MNRLMGVLGLLLSFVSACGASTPQGEGAGPSANDPFAQEILLAHNAARAAVSPAAKSALSPLTWSQEAATVAAQYASKCIFEHNAERSDFGENLYASSGNSTGTKVVEDWAAEKQDYDYGLNACSGVCGHYTQVVWAATTQVGCAKQSCTRNSPFGSSASWEIWVCNYAPPGNYVGQKPY